MNESLNFSDSPEGVESHNSNWESHLSSHQSVLQASVGLSAAPFGDLKKYIKHTCQPVNTEHCLTVTANFLIEGEKVIKCKDDSKK